MTHYEELEIKLRDMLSLQQQIRLFALTSLTEDNPFRPLIEQQAVDSAERLRETLQMIPAQVSEP
jgi:hypothetical protein